MKQNTKFSQPNPVLITTCESLSFSLEIYNLLIDKHFDTNESDNKLILLERRIDVSMSSLHHFQV